MTEVMDCGIGRAAKSLNSVRKDDALRSLTLLIASADSCKDKEFIPGDREEQFFVVESVEGVNSLTELAELVKKKRTGTTDTASESKVRGSQIENEPIQTWMITEDKSKIDDSPSITRYRHS